MERRGEVGETQVLRTVQGVCKCSSSDKCAILALTCELHKTCACNVQSSGVRVHTSPINTRVWCVSQIRVTSPVRMKPCDNNPSFFMKSLEVVVQASRKLQDFKMRPLLSMTLHGSGKPKHTQHPYALTRARVNLTKVLDMGGSFLIGIPN